MVAPPAKRGGRIERTRRPRRARRRGMRRGPGEKMLLLLHPFTLFLSRTLLFWFPLSCVSRPGTADARREGGVATRAVGLSSLPPLRDIREERNKKKKKANLFQGSASSLRLAHFFFSHRDTTWKKKIKNLSEISSAQNAVHQLPGRRDSDLVRARG